MPSDTIYGLSARAEDQAAVEKLHKLKKRDSIKPFIVLISDISQLTRLNVKLNNLEPVEKYWPGALSVVFEAPAAPAWLTRSTGSLAVRLPDSPALRDLISRVGPIVSTSANKAGQPAIDNPRQAQLAFGENLDFYVDGGKLANRLPSTIIKLNSSGIEVLRPGAVKIDQKEQ